MLRVVRSAAAEVRLVSRWHKALFVLRGTVTTFLVPLDKFYAVFVRSQKQTF